MILRSAVTILRRTRIAIVLVEVLPPPAGADALLLRLTPFFPTLPIMLVAIANNGFAAYSTFQSHELLSLLQLERLTFVDLDPEHPPTHEIAPPF